ncbi:MAG: carbon-nitrogen hydrolase family protein [Candidatus Bathyarchaeota archaeon]|nr:carbon-nitrogen hydrolase family protein [Candidatus Bathyarchaeota archaeon]
MKLVIACHQISFSSNKHENLNRILRTLEKVNAQIHVFPEYSMGNLVNGLTPVFVKKNAESLDGPFVTKVLEKTRELNLAVVFTVFLKENTGIFNAAILVEKGKIKALYKKIHLFDAFGYNESRIFSPGNEIVLATIKGFKIGLAVCFDLRFPELFRAMAYKGADLFIVPSAWYKGKYKVEQWQVLALSRAHENGAYLVAVDQTNPFFIGHSIITSPFATVLKKIGEEEESFVVELDYERILESRKLIPILSLSKPDIYRTF